MIDLKDIGNRVTCPKCGKEGIVRVLRTRKKGREYLYLVVRHYDENRYCIIKRVNIESIEGIEDVLKLISELEELKKNVRSLEKENKELKEENEELCIENSVLKDRLGFYEEIWRKSIIISKDERIEEKINKIKDLLKQYDGVRILPYKLEVQIVYGVEKE